MPVALQGVTTVFTLSSASSTALANPNNTRRYVLITNGDTAITVYVGVGTNNAATVGMIPIPPGGHLEWLNNQFGPGQISGQQPNVPRGDIAAIAASGSPQISYTEW